MANTTARTKKQGKTFEILVDMDAAIKFKKGLGGSAMEFLAIERISKDVKKGDAVPKSELESCFGTNDIYKIAEEIVRGGEILVDQTHRTAEQEQKVKQV
jgi:ribosome maturation protein SDO1